MAASKTSTGSPLLLRPFARMLRSEGIAPPELVARVEAIEASERRVQ